MGHGGWGGSRSSPGYWDKKQTQPTNIAAANCSAYSRRQTRAPFRKDSAANEGLSSGEDWPPLDATPFADKAAEHAKELSHIRLEQVKLLRQENEILRAELETMNEMVGERNDRIKSLQRSLELFVELLVIWLQSLGDTESQRIVNTLIEILVVQSTKNADSSLVKEGLEKVYFQLSQRSGGGRVGGETPPVLSGPPPRKRLPRSQHRRAVSPPEPAATVPGATDAQRVPPLKLGAVGTGTWMSGDRTAGDIYIE
eukprot:Gregarina_sp_Poly_1__767@NODE_1183_length_4845_cov_142_002721_g813_i0_p3_GENE_NODE_1183_length_4845_cov_142_002721_g813_i0NODE_1183_length_4845_cov_142_002721_g813_i0_p3_ORF_typecomplete_len255_score50_95Golgin_A5/PF09787_9/0_0064MPS2/PF17060_5/0_0097DUF3972/PF13118_6/0_018HAP1_N/PF04849_13/0_028Phage_HK97_TLTM/PF06120_11/0_032Atg14/PF10186_9/0_044DUF5094/PF17015_5/0_096JIP_LZII/PF16471_5/0_14Yuri_gagarin/PF15934_5/0_12TMF_TATA_bd/PF12325_8/0_17bZIP_2/PF07716_15/0_41DUF4831/PF16115_5/0_22_NODE_1